MSEIKNKPGAKILIVEDDDVNRKIMDMQLRNYYQLDLAKDGKEAIDLFSQNDYSMVLMDINLGVGINGIETMKKIRESNKGKTVPVIAITAYANFGDRGVFKSEGFDNYISKPYHSDDLLKCIMDAISNF